MSTSKLQRQVSILLGTYLGRCTIRENTRPEWLNGLELDFYIEELQVGIEVQGQQHYAYTPHFHKSYDDFCAQQERDNLKYELCLRNDVELHYITSTMQAVGLIERLVDIEITMTDLQAALSAIDDYLYLNPKTRQWLQSYQRALKNGKSKRAEHFRQLLEQYIRKHCGVT